MNITHEDVKNPYADIPDVEPEADTKTDLSDKLITDIGLPVIKEEELEAEEEREQLDDAICLRCNNYSHCIKNFSTFCDERLKIQKRLNRAVEKAEGKRGWNGFWARQNEKERDEEIKKAIEIIQHEATLMAAINAALHRVLEEIPRAISDKNKMAMLERHKASLIEMVEEVGK